MFEFFLLDCKPTIYYFAMKVLVIEDDQDLREIITRSLEKERYVVETAANYRTARQKALGYEYDCLLLDIMLPDGNGLDLLRVLREKERKFNVIILSAKDSIEDKVNGLDLGADDYLAKPFHLAELHARLKSVLRRRQRDLAGRSLVRRLPGRMVVTFVIMSLGRMVMAIMLRMVMSLGGMVMIRMVVRRRLGGMVVVVVMVCA